MVISDLEVTMPAHTIPQDTDSPASAPVAPPLAPETPDVTTAYMVRLETYLAGLPAAERRPALKSLRTWWIQDYDRWTFRIDTETATAGDLKISATDYLLTIAALGARLDREPGQ